MWYHRLAVRFGNESEQEPWHVYLGEASGFDAFIPRSFERWGIVRNALRSYSPSGYVTNRISSQKQERLEGEALQVDISDN